MFLVSQADFHIHYLHSGDSKGTAQASEYLVREDCSIAAGCVMPAPDYIR